jgi:hypothetical protein
MSLHLDILDEKRRSVLPKLKAVSEGFYLAGGTALALLIGHRDSIDFDFFTKDNFDTNELFEKTRQAFQGHEVLKTQEEKGTLSVIIDGAIRLSFFHYPYPLIADIVSSDFFPLASIQDIGCMKLSAITGRSALKDYVDIHFIFTYHSLAELLMLTKSKMPSLDPLLILKSLAYFDDIVDDPIIFKTEPVLLVDIRQEFIKKAAEITLQP